MPRIHRTPFRNPCYTKPIYSKCSDVLFKAAFMHQGILMKFCIFFFALKTSWTRCNSFAAFQSNAQSVRLEFLIIEEAIGVRIPPVSTFTPSNSLFTNEQILSLQTISPTSKVPSVWKMQRPRKCFLHDCHYESSLMYF